MDFKELTDNIGLNLTRFNQKYSDMRFPEKSLIRKISSKLKRELNLNLNPEIALRGLIQDETQLYRELYVVLNYTEFFDEKVILRENSTMDFCENIFHILKKKRYDILEKAYYIGYKENVIYVECSIVEESNFVNKYDFLVEFKDYINKTNKKLNENKHIVYSVETEDEIILFISIKARSQKRVRTANGKKFKHISYANTEVYKFSKDFQKLSFYIPNRFVKGGLITTEYIVNTVKDKIDKKIEEIKYEVSNNLTNKTDLLYFFNKLKDNYESEINLSKVKFDFLNNKYEISSNNQPLTNGIINIERK
ncbi:MAG: hypothetical protein HRU03_08230, partial [Nanoarchaeales archaeon]|nr:hypothetical protein [Nanoarchaeales archaeon]